MLHRILRLNNRKFSAGEIEVLVKQALNVISDIARPEELYLFGSAVSGSFDEESDLDFVLVYPDAVEAESSRRKLTRQRAHFPCSIDLVCMSQSEFARKSESGGVSFLAVNEGKRLI